MPLEIGVTPPECLQVPMTSGRAEASEQGLGKRSVQQLEAETASLPPVATAPKRQKKVATAPPQLAVPTGKEGKLQKSCMNCGTKSTPVWRSGPNGTLFCHLPAYRPGKEPLAHSCFWTWCCHDLTVQSCRQMPDAACACTHPCTMATRLECEVRPT